MIATQINETIEPNGYVKVDVDVLDCDQNIIGDMMEGEQVNLEFTMNGDEYIYEDCIISSFDFDIDTDSCVGGSFTFLYDKPIEFKTKDGIDMKMRKSLYFKIYDQYYEPTKLTEEDIKLCIAALSL